ncbi:thiol methyltransferase 1 [Epithele typhae]|uniref:thiol methyltransferase 1 n=1 Tax=Epithele typhae TaxID=378194 RepID=UPI00200789D8|nr:thiol methyltransferase 1 [Epithele typhae]KAH9916762.1 thiol methyltransferase 1 [Epithele typhae]
MSDGRAQMQALIAEHKEKGWDEAWKKAVTPWDVGQVQPPLAELLGSGELQLPAQGDALIPGCGRGYDAVHIAQTTGLRTLGMDISETAVRAAEEYRNETGADPAKVRFKMMDFFLETDEQFDLVYDYTFFVAIPPARRAEWGKQMTRIVKPGGYLVTLIWPIAEYTELGPPFYVRPEHYEEVLGEGWEVVVDRVPSKSLETHQNKERLVVRRRL